MVARLRSNHLMHCNNNGVSWSENQIYMLFLGWLDLLVYERNSVFNENHFPHPWVQFKMCHVYLWKMRNSGVRRVQELPYWQVGKDVLGINSPTQALSSFLPFLYLSLSFSLPPPPPFSKICSFHLTIPFSHNFRRNSLTSLKMVRIENEVL